MQGLRESLQTPPVPAGSQEDSHRREALPLLRLREELHPEAHAAGPPARPQRGAALRLRRLLQVAVLQALAAGAHEPAPRSAPTDPKNPPKKTFTCDKCEKSFTQKRQLKNHYRTHTGKSLPECAECQRRFMDTAQLKKHLRTHTGEKPFTCEICGKCFTAKSTLQTHIRIHRGEKPFDCGVCGKTFSDPSARRRHAATHSGKKAFTCSVCSLSFTRLDNLKTHAKTHSREGGAADAQEEPRGALLLQPPLGSEPEIQLLVTDQNLSFAAGQQEISLLAADGGAAHPTHSKFTLLAQTDAVTPPIHAVSMLDPHPEQMHIITLSKEAVEQLQAHHDTPPSHGTAPGQVSRPPSRAIHVSSQSGQPISISQTGQQLCSHHIQGQSFQIQAGTVSYLYASGLPQDTPPPETTPLQKLPGS
ncbi:zinc finger and BTB domain-containing protein 24 [Oryzias latipes]